MLKLNLLPASFRQKGTVKAAAILVIIVWLITLALLGVYAYLLNLKIVAAIADVAAKKADVTLVNNLTKDQDAYTAEYSRIKPETDFLKDVTTEPGQIATVMHDVARGTSNKIVIEKYTITPGGSNVVLTAVAMDYVAFNRWRLDLLQDPDFVGVPTMTEPGGGGTAGGSGGSGGSGGPPSPMSSPAPAGGAPTQTAAGSFNIPPAFRQAFVTTVTLNLVHKVSMPAFNAAPAAPAGGGPGGGSPGGGSPGGGSPGPRGSAA